MRSIKIFKLLILVIFLLSITFPYIWADALGGQDHIFSGFLINPKDGYSYLAKMYQGYEGNWKYSFPYSLDGGHGAYLFLFYLFLGHFSRAARLELIIVYHIVRILSAGILFFILWTFYERVVPEKKYATLAFILSLFGSGLGWMGSLVGYHTSDLWIAEAYPFLSSFSNSHFPLTLGLIIWLVTPFDPVCDRGCQIPFKKWITIAVLSSLIAIISPFGSILVLVINAGGILWEFVEQARNNHSAIEIRKIAGVILKLPYFNKLLLISAFSFPILVYYWWVSKVDPIVAEWSTQNITPSPPGWDFVLSFSPALLCAIPGCIRVLQEGRREMRILLVWILCGLALAYFPYGLQRRFMVGYFLPVAGLAGLGLAELSRHIPAKAWISAVLILLLSLPSNLLILMTSNYAGSRHDENVYLTTAENAGLRWLREEVPEQRVILASPQTGLMIPALTGHRVLYGHPFETVQAEYWENIVTDFFRGSLRDNLLSQVDYVFYGPREKKIGRCIEKYQLPIVYANDEVIIYQTDR